MANAYGPTSELNPERIKQEFGEGQDMKLRFDSDGHQIDHKGKRGRSLVVLSNSPVQRLGRGIAEMQEAELGPANLQLDELSDKIGGCPWAIRSAAISAKGHFVSCCGFEVEDNPILDYGDLNKESLHSLLERADNDLLSNMIAILGPIKMMRLLQQICPDEVLFPRSYRSYCEVCSDLVSFKQNRDALYKHMGKFAQLVLDIRRIIKERYTQDGRVVLPDLQIVTLTKPTAGAEGIPLERAEDKERAVRL